MEGKVILNEYVTGVKDTKSVISEKRSTEAELNKYWKAEVQNVHREKLSESITLAMQAARRLVLQRLDIVPVKETAAFEVLDAKKIEETPAFQQQFGALKAALEGITADQSLERARELAAAPLDYFEKLAAKYNDPGEKSHRKIRAACLLNLATAHYCLENFDQAVEYAQLVEALGFFEKKAQDIAKKAKGVKEGLAVRNCATQHFPYAPPADATAPDIAYENGNNMVANAEQERSDVAIFPAYFINEKGKFTGEVEITGDGAVLDFRNNGNVKFFRTDTGKRHQAYLNPEWVSEVGFDGRVFEPGHNIFAVSMGGKPNTFRERLYQSKSVTVYRFYEFETTEPVVATALALQKDGEKQPVSVEGLKFVNFTKGLANYFADCPDLSQRAANKAFERTAPSLVAAAKAYTACKEEPTSATAEPLSPPAPVVTQPSEEPTLSNISQLNEKEPSFPGGEQKMMEFLSANIKYPAEALKNKISGKVYLQVVVEKDGSLSNIKVIRDIGGGCGEEALRVVQMMPKWNPGEQGGRPVTVRFTMPVQFRLD